MAPSTRIPLFSNSHTSNNSISPPITSTSPPFHPLLATSRGYPISTYPLPVSQAQSHRKSPTYPNSFHLISLVD
ncbi:hypothetical protein RHMOL_Rhmol01G0074600 [Rhododendron molle]|uniref:Uncharacterized protein n=1 Tax=Rhododendron molle TaxID=49168 RepID=A0ACC0Q0H1_RHOML|nr:hypothetical protein RHMOL_Rhmol01G0074600 [Rhododendron molle]